MLNGTLDKMTDWLNAMLAPTTEAASTSQEEQWVPVDRAAFGSISMYASSKSGEIGVYYYHGTEVTSENLVRCYKNLETHLGSNIARPLLAPFQGHYSADSQDAWLSSDIINRYFSSLQSSTVVAIDSGYFDNPDFVASLVSRDRRKIAERLHNANLIYWPVCLRNKHWYVMVIQRAHGNDFSIRVLDTYNHTEAHQQIAEKGVELLNALYHGAARVVNYGFPSSLVPVQSTNADCGASIAYFAYQKLRGGSLNDYEEYSSAKCNYVQFRMHMALTLEAQALAAVEHRSLSASPSPSRPLTPSYASTTRPRLTDSQELEIIAARKQEIKVF